MPRAVRKVPAGWEHPRDVRGDYVPLFDGDVAQLQAKWDVELDAWNSGRVRDHTKPGAPYRPRLPSDGDSFDDWDGQRPALADYMPQWSENERTHFQFYETTSEGTPLSPPMPSIAALAIWCVDNMDRPHPSRRDELLADTVECFVGAVARGGSL